MSTVTTYQTTVYNNGSTNIVVLTETVSETVDEDSNSSVSDPSQHGDINSTPEEAIP